MIQCEYASDVIFNTSEISEPEHECMAVLFFEDGVDLATLVRPTQETFSNYK